MWQICIAGWFAATGTMLYYYSNIVQDVSKVRFFFNVFCPITHTISCFIYFKWLLRAR